MGSMWSGRHRSRFNQPKPKVWSDSWIRIRDVDGTLIHTQCENRGYGWTHYVFVGSLEGITREVDSVLRSYPQAGYGTWFNWPPGRTNHEGKPISHNEPFEIEPGLWVLFGSHSESCD